MVPDPERPPVPLRAGAGLAVISWNLQYAAGRRHRFFYDGGTAVHVPADDVRDTLAGMTRLLAEEAPGLVLLQEVDRDSRRTGRVDQLPPLADAVGAAATASTTVHRVRFLPVPLRRPLGRVDMHLAILSRHRLANPTRVPLPALREGPLRRAFNLRRAVLWATIPVEGGPDLDVAVTHLSAFSRGDGTLPRQAAILDRWMRDRESAGRPFVLAGDLNLLPPGDDPARLGPDAAEYRDDPNPMVALLAAHRSAVPTERLLEPTWRTYLPFGEDAPDRVLDYLFVGPGVEVESVRVLTRRPDLSDHLPLRADLRLPGARAWT